jgi:hypothetical protein
VEDDGADEATAEAVDEVRVRPTRVPLVTRTTSLRPDVMVRVSRLADAVHGSGGSPDRRARERIATASVP